MIFQGRFSIFLMHFYPQRRATKLQIINCVFNSIKFKFLNVLSVCERQADTPHSGGDYVRVVTASGKRDGVNRQCRIFQ